jgi:hypothetical protein
MDLKAPVMRPFCTLEVEAGPVLDMGTGRYGRRRIVPITGGRVSGLRLAGRIIGGGADGQTVSTDGVAEMDARYALQTDDGAIVEIIDRGFRHGPEEVMKRLAAGEPVAPGSYYMRSAVRLETGHAGYAWVNRMVFVGTGARPSAGVQIDIYAIE